MPVSPPVDTTPRKRVKPRATTTTTTTPQTNITNVQPHSPHQPQQNQSDRDHHHYQRSQYHHHNNHHHRNSSNHPNHNSHHHEPQQQQEQHQQQLYQHHHSKQNGHSVNSKDNGVINGGVAATRSIKVCANNKELDTISDKQNQNTWFITNERSYYDYDSPGIPVIPLFTHTANSVDFHKNNSGSYNNNNGVGYMNNSWKGTYANGTSTTKPIPSRRNDCVHEEKDLLNMGRIQELRDRMGSDRGNVNEKALWKCLGAEFLGTALLMFLGIGCVLKIQELPAKELSFVGIALCWGFTVATLVQSLGGVSADFNPAVTLACLVTGKTTIVKTIMYILIQCLGALAGTALLKAVTPDTIEGRWGMTQLAPGVTPIQGCLIELVSTFVLVFTAFSATDENRKDVKGSVPLAIGICICAIVMCSGPLTGASLNPARTLAPCIIAGEFVDHWIYWVGPIVGGICGGALYHNIFRHLRPDEIEALEADTQLRRQEREAKENGTSPPV